MSIAEAQVKQALKPYFIKDQITKQEYKDIMRHTVPKVGAACLVPTIFNFVITVLLYLVCKHVSWKWTNFQTEFDVQMNEFLVYANSVGVTGHNTDMCLAM